MAVAVDVLRDPVGAERLEALLQPRHDSVRALLANAADRGDLPADVDADLVQHIVVGALLFRMLIGQTSSDCVVEQLLDLIPRGEVPRTGQIAPSAG